MIRPLLTLALDSHATACSPLLHATLLAEARRPGANGAAPTFHMKANAVLKI